MLGHGNRHRTQLTGRCSPHLHRIARLGSHLSNEEGLVEECAWEAKRVDCGGKMYCRGNEWLADSALEVAEYGPTWEHDGIWEGHGRGWQ